MHNVFADGDRITGGEALTITRTEKDDAGDYSCVLTTPAGSLSSNTRSLVVHCESVFIYVIMQYNYITI